MRRQIPALGSLLVVAAVLCVLPFILSDYNIYLASQVGIFFIAVLGLNILTGYTGQISIGHGAFMAIGGYTTAVMSRDHGTNLVVTMLMAFAICFVVGLLVGLPALRLSGVYLALVTFALAVSIPYLPLQYSTFLGGSGGVTVRQSQIPSNLWVYTTAWACSAILFVLAWLILRGRVGRAFRAVRDSEIAAVASGVELPVYKTLAFGISAAYAGVAGSLLVLALNGFAQPSEFDVFLSLQILVGAAVAGLGSLWGILVGAAFVGLLPQISTSVPVIGAQHGRDVVFGATVILVMLLLPDGVAGLLPRIRSLNRDSISIKMPRKSSL
jgi:branched-chain amino acid transport system permease protein